MDCEEKIFDGKTGQTGSLKTWAGLRSKKGRENSEEGSAYSIRAREEKDLLMKRSDIWLQSDPAIEIGEKEKL